MWSHRAVFVLRRAAEIDKCLKKISDGVVDFDSLLDLVQAQGQKDKFDGESEPRRLAGTFSLSIVR
jgi:hypothetical protein